MSWPGKAPTDMTGAYAAGVTAPALADLAARFRTLDYRVDAVIDVIGDEAHRALGRNITLPAVRALEGRDDPLAVLTRLWLLQRPVPRSTLERALPGLVDPLAGAGILAIDGDQIRAAIDIRPYASDEGDFWVASDLTPNLDTLIAPIRPDHVLGVSAASATLAQLTLRRPVDTALDLGTGCGVQTLHLARHSRRIIATDLNPRACQLARLTFDLNATTVDVRLGDLYQPVAAGEGFDLIVANPPYVMSPPGLARLTYREGDATADTLVERVVTEGAALLTEGGVLHVLANWAHVRGQDWIDRVGGWVTATGCDAHVVQREVLDPSAYIEVWLADAGLTGSPAYAEHYRAWSDYFDRLRIEAVGLGWLVLHNAGRPEPWIRIENRPHPLEQPIGPALAAELDAVDRLSGMSDDQILQTRWRLAEDVMEETTGRPGQADPQHIVVRQQIGLRRAYAVDTATAGILGACDGELTLAEIVGAVSELVGADQAALTRDAVRQVRELVLDGLLRC
jgi:methylase of polypeptide subunit release factors